MERLAPAMTMEEFAQYDAGDFLQLIDSCERKEPI